MVLRLLTPVPLFAFALACAAAPPALAAPSVAVHPNCTMPSPAKGRVWVVDPVNGSPDGDGSAARPWQSLQAVLDRPSPPGALHAALQALRASPIKPGDTILLMSGNHGNIRINYRRPPTANNAFLTIAAAPGQTPRATMLQFDNASRIIVRDLKIQSTADGYNPLVNFADRNKGEQAEDIILDNLDISSADNVDDWSKADWLAKARFQGLRSDGSFGAIKCLTVRNSVFRNLRNGAALMAENSLFTNNRIDNVGGDFVAFAASNLIISRNILTNSNTLGDGNHNDFMQGQIGRKFPDIPSNQYRNILIDGNLAIRQTSATSVRFPGMVQGISAFNSDWFNVTVSNNVVISSTCHGMSFASLHGARIINNTVLDDGSTIGTRNPKGSVMCQTWIRVGGASHEGSPSNDVVVRNNIATGLVMASKAPNRNMIMDNNICLANNGRCLLSYDVDGKTIYNNNEGTYSNGKAFTKNRVDGAGTKGMFINYAPENYQFDVRLRPGAKARAAGNADGAPAQDFSGNRRGTPPDIGAHAATR